MFGAHTPRAFGSRELSGSFGCGLGMEFPVGSPWGSGRPLVPAEKEVDAGSWNRLWGPLMGSP